MMKTIAELATMTVLTLALFAGQTAAATISAVGVDTTTLGSWRTASVAKPLDADGNKIYGSAGYEVFSTGATGLFEPASPTTANTLTALPAAVSLSFTGINSSFSGAYPIFDNPSTTPGGSPSTTNSGFSWVNAAAATATSLLNINVNGSIGEFRLGVIQNGAGPDLVSLTLTSGAASATVAVNKLTSDDNSVRYAFFDVTADPGSTLTLSALSVHGGTVGISGLTFDLVPTPEPSSLLLGGLALAGILGFHFRTRRGV